MANKATFTRASATGSLQSLITNYNANLDILEQAIQDSLSLSGKLPNSLAAPVDMNGEPIINVQDAQNDSDAVTKRQLDSAVAGNPLWTQAGVGAVSRTMQDKFRETLSVKDFGAVCDGISDDTVAVQAAIVAAQELGNSLYIEGICRVTATLTITNPIHIYGDGCTADVTTSGGNVAAPIAGSWVFLDHSGVGFYCRDDDAVGESKLVARFENIGTYRFHAAPTGGWTPTAHAEDFRVEFRVHLNNVFMLNPYIGVKVRSSGVLWVDKLYGQPLFTGIELERSADVNNYEDIHFWPFWTQEANVVGYTLDNAVGIRVARCDGLKASNIFTYGYHRTILAQDATGIGAGFSGFSISNVYADKCGGAIEINCDFYEAYGTFSSVLVNADSAVGGSGPGVWIAGTIPAQITILGLEVTRAHEEALKVNEGAHVVNVQPNKIKDWNTLSAGDAAFSAENGATVNLLSLPAFSGGGTQYSAGVSGIIILPVGFRIGYPAISGQGFNSRRVTIADDSVAITAAPVTDKTVLMALVPTGVPGAGNPTGLYWLRCTGSPAATGVNASTTTNVDVGTGILTGTTGTDGNLRINAANDGNIYIENRTGVSRTFVLTFFGN